MSIAANSFRPVYAVLWGNPLEFPVALLKLSSPCGSLLGLFSSRTECNPRLRRKRCQFDEHIVIVISYFFYLLTSVTSDRAHTAAVWALALCRRTMGTTRSSGIATTALVSVAVLEQVRAVSAAQLDGARGSRLLNALMQKLGCMRCHWQRASLHKVQLHHAFASKSKTCLV